MLSLCIAASALYLAIAYRQFRRIRKQESGTGFYFLPLTLIAMALHGYLAFPAVNALKGDNLGLVWASMLAFWIINLVFLLTLWRRPIHNIAVLLFPLAALSILATAFVD